MPHAQPSSAPGFTPLPLDDLGNAHRLIRRGAAFCADLDEARIRPVQGGEPVTARNLAGIASSRACVRLDIANGKVTGVWVSAGMISPEVTSGTLRRNLGYVGGELLEQRDQHGDNYFVTIRAAELHGKKPLAFIIDDGTNFHGVLALRRDYSFAHIQLLSVGTSNLPTVTEPGEAANLPRGGEA